MLPPQPPPSQPLVGALLQVRCQLSVRCLLRAYIPCTNTVSGDQSLPRGKPPIQYVPPGSIYGAYSPMRKASACPPIQSGPVARGVDWPILRRLSMGTMQVAAFVHKLDVERCLSGPSPTYCRASAAAVSIVVIHLVVSIKDGIFPCPRDRRVIGFFPRLLDFGKRWYIENLGPLPPRTISIANVTLIHLQSWARAAESTSISAKCGSGCSIDRPCHTSA
ncbi:hypothetical protein F5Y01DRAFT_16674 [Xylaria sp. FL0043]|nr:hypothetical protein F5Y01DRAFT_16674 [Xylaria sp. FL0043]